mmetsp:Transcript_37010/g.35732  ORF Transcript_37010/g.35732 Transcript_37010/m.35732 type:complete len:110 (-) Transcript_37010:32-361(-)
MFQRENLNLANGDVLKEVERIVIEKEYIKQQASQEGDHSKTINYFYKLFEASDPHTLIDKVNQSQCYINEVNLFMKMIRGALNMDQSVTVSTCLNTVKNIVMSVVYQQS